MSNLPVIVDETGCERRLGLLLPQEFPKAFNPMAGSVYNVLTKDEIYNFLKPRSSAHHRVKQFDFSWVLNQLHFGSCNGHAIASVLAKMRYLRGEGKVLLSGSDAYSQMNGGHDNGSALQDAMLIVQRNGIAPLDLNPTDHIFDHQVSAAAKAARARFKGFECLAIDDEIELASWIILHGMAVVCVHATNSLGRVDSNGVSQGANGYGNHSVHADDVRLLNNELQFRMVNSWGKWGVDGQGYVWMVFKRHFSGPIKRHRFFGLPCAIDDPLAKNSVPVPKVLVS